MEEKLSPGGIIFINFGILIVIGLILWLISLFGMSFVYGFITATAIFQVGYRCKHGEWYVDS